MFFHAFASNRRRRNMIQSLKYENEWINDVHEIEKKFLNDLYVSNMNSNFSFEDCNCNQVDLATQNDLGLPPTNMDITNALNRIGPDKAPVPDGLNAHFFQKYWNHVGPATITLVKQNFHSNTLNHKVNETKLF